MNELQRERRAHRSALRGMEAGTPGWRPRVLLAEDQHADLLAIADLLGQCGISVDLASGGEAAIGRVLDGEAIGIAYDLLLIDLTMPDCDGPEAARALRIAGYPPSLLPILALTEGQADARAQAALRGAGMQGWIAKPLTLETLVPTLNRWLPHTILGEDCVAEQTSSSAST